MKFAKLAFSIVVGFFVGSLLNMALVMVSGMVIPPPNGADVSTMEGLKNSIGLFEPKHFLFPFLAHSLGTLLGSFVAAILQRKSYSALAGFAVGGFFLMGGIANVLMIPSPLWFTLVDLFLAYVPFSAIAVYLAKPRTITPSA